MSKVVSEIHYMCLKCHRRFSGHGLFSPIELLIPDSIYNLLGIKKVLQCPHCKSKKVMPVPGSPQPPFTN